MRKWMFSLIAAVALLALALPVQATPLGGASKGLEPANPSGIELVHHRPGHRMKHHDRGRHYGWVRGKHKGWHKKGRHLGVRKHMH